MSEPLRVGLIGAGYIATWHADALAATPSATVAARGAEISRPRRSSPSRVRPPREAGRGGRPVGR